MQRTSFPNQHMKFFISPPVHENTKQTTIKVSRYVAGPMAAPHVSGTGQERTDSACMAYRAMVDHSHATGRHHQEQRTPRNRCTCALQTACEPARKLNCLPRSQDRDAASINNCKERAYLRYALLFLFYPLINLVLTRKYTSSPMHVHLVFKFCF